MRIENRLQIAELTSLPASERDLYSSQFDAAAVEMRLLRRQLASGQFADAVASAQRVPTLLAFVREQSFGAEGEAV